MSITIRMGITGFQNFSFSVLWLAFFANQHTKLKEKCKLLELIQTSESKHATVIKESSNLGSFSDTRVSFLIKTKFF